MGSALIIPRNPDIGQNKRRYITCLSIYLVSLIRHLNLRILIFCFLGYLHISKDKIITLLTFLL